MLLAAEMAPLMVASMVVPKDNKSVVRWAHCSVVYSVERLVETSAGQLVSQRAARWAKRKATLSAAPMVEQLAACWAALWDRSMVALTAIRWEMSLVVQWVALMASQRADPKVVMLVAS